MLSSLYDFLRIRFIGRPYELNKLIYDYSTIINDDEEANKVIQAAGRFYGFQNLGLVISLCMASCMICSRRRISKINSPKWRTVAYSSPIIPLLSFYLYSHFTYWHIIREVVIATRKRSREFQRIDKSSKDQYLISFNKSKDLHNKIKSSIGFIKSIKEVI